MNAKGMPTLLILLSVFCTLNFTTRVARANDTKAAAQSAEGKPAESQTEAAPDWKIQVETWTKPQPGWLYVLDPRPLETRPIETRPIETKLIETKPGGDTPGGRVWLVDPGSGKVMGSVRTGENPDFALSPDGSRLYVASIIAGDLSDLAMIDTAEGKILARATAEDREVGKALPAFSTMAVSGDGLALRILIDAPKSDDADSFLFATFDTQTGKFLSRSVHLGNCGPGRFIAYPSADEFDVLCPRTNRIRLIRVDADSRELQNADIKLPWERRIGAAVAIEAAGAEDIAIVRGDGGVFRMNLATGEFSETGALPVNANRVPPAAWPTSPDGGTLYLGYNDGYDKQYDNRFYLDYGRPPNLRPDNALAFNFHVYDTQSWRKVGTIKTKMPFWSAVTSSDGKTMYATAPQKHSILVIDTGKMRQVGAFQVGGAPALALVAP